MVSNSSSKRVIWILIAVIAILVAFLVYSFLLQPKMSGYVVNKQLEGYQIAYSEILQVVSQCQTLPIPVGENGTQVVTLVALECLQNPQNSGTQTPLASDSSDISA